MTTPLPAELADFPVSIELPVQWGDQDAFGHVNNTVYFRWYESARIAYLERLEMADQNSALGLGPILAAIGSQLSPPGPLSRPGDHRQPGHPHRPHQHRMEHAVWSTAQQAFGRRRPFDDRRLRLCRPPKARSPRHRPGDDRATEGREL